MPMPSARPPSDMMLRLTPNRLSGAKVTSSEIGMLTAMMAVVRRSLQEQEQHQDGEQPADQGRVADLGDAATR